MRPPRIQIWEAFFIYYCKVNVLLRVLFFILRILLILVFPFFIFLKSAVWCHESYDLPSMINVILAMLVLVIVLLLYLSVGYTYLFRKLGTAESFKQRFIFISILVLVTSFHVLFFISDSQVKSQELRKEYVQLHPILRLATGVISKVDKELVITDISRSAADYGRMGLSVNENSLHLPQKDGYSYAVDIRTIGKSEFVISALKLYYKALGFKTLRHTGTADHLHISISCPSKLKK